MERNYIGRQFSGAVPCFDFVAEVMRDRGLDLPGYQYQRAEHAEALRRHIVEHAERVDSPAPGDVVLLMIGGNPAHIGVMINQQEFMHHDERLGVIAESVRASHWRRRVAGYYRPRIPQPASG